MLLWFCLTAISLSFSGNFSFLTLWSSQEVLRRAERKNRDEFRKLLEGDVASGTLTAKTHWRDYCMKVRMQFDFVLEKYTRLLQSAKSEYRCFMHSSWFFYVFAHIND